MSKFKVALNLLFISMVFGLFVYLVKPDMHNVSHLSEMQGAEAETDNSSEEQKDAYQVMSRKFFKEANKSNDRELAQRVEAAESTQGIRDGSSNDKDDNRQNIIYEDEFSKDVVLPNGKAVPILKSNILGDSEEIELQFKLEKRNERWAGSWENTLNNIVGSAGAQFDMGAYDVTCKSKTCKIGVKLSESNPYGYDEAFRAMNKEFVLNDMQVVPGPIKEKGTDYIVYYYFPDN